MGSKTGDVARSPELAAIEWDYAERVTEPVPACNLCGGTRLVELSRRDRYGYAAPCQTCICCGLAWLSPRLTAEEYAEFYASVYRPLVSAHHGRQIDARTIQVEQRGYADELVLFLAAALPSGPRTVLDVGGSTGVVVAAVSDAFGSEGAVLDPSPDELAHAADAGFETIAGFAEDVDLGKRTFDLVLLCQTIDHLLDIGATLRSIRRWVAPGGRVFVDVLDVEFTMLRRGSIERAVKIDHPFSLTRATALAYFEQAGLRPTAERLSDDGHIGFVLEPVEPAEPDWSTLGVAAEAFRRCVWHLRAAA